jgi:hypothetical protein
VVTEIEVVRVDVPESFLEPCPVTPLPVYGVAWEDLGTYIKSKHIEQIECNSRFDRIREWKNTEN